MRLRNNIYALLFFYTLQSVNFILAQNPLHKVLSPETKFPSATVYDIYQDKAGFMWFGTDAGLVRFDGKHYQLYPPDVITGKAVSNILESEGGVIWCQNFSGKFYHTRNDSLIYQPHISLYSNYVVANILNDTILASRSSKGVSLFNTRTGQQKTITLPNTDFLASVQTNHKAYFLHSYSGIVSVDHKGTIHTYKAEKTEGFNYFVKLKDRIIGLSKSGNFDMIASSPPQRTSLKPLLKNSILQNVIALPRNRLALLTTAGFHILDQNLNPGIHYFPEDNTSCILEDKEGNLWIGTLNRGVIFIPHPEIRSFLNDLSFTAITEAEPGYFFAGTYHNEILKITYKDYKPERIASNTEIHHVTSILYNRRQKELMYGSPFLYRYHNGKNQLICRISINEIKQLDSTHYLLSEGGCLSLFPVQKNDHWYNWSGKKNITLEQQRLALGGEFIRVKSSEKINDSIFFASSRGLMRFCHGSEKEILWHNKSLLATKLNKKGDSLLIATLSNGIFLYYKGLLKPFVDSTNGLLSHDIISFHYHNDLLYILSTKGFDIFSTNGQKQLSLLHSESLLNAGIKDFLIRNDTIIALGSRGIIEIPLSVARKPIIAPRLKINSLLVNRVPIKTNQPLYFTHNQNEIEVAFSLLDYRGQNATQIVYSINGTPWKELHNASLMLTALQSGIYEVKLKAISARGLESTEATVNFEIAPPVYKTWWFLSLSIIIILTTLLLLFRYRLKTVERKTILLSEKAELEKALHQSTLASIKSQMNPHFIFNALNTIQSYIYLNDKKSAADYLVQFSELTRHILEMSNKEKVSLHEELKALKLYLDLEKMRFEDDFNYQITKHDVETETIYIPSMLIQPYVENAIKHGLLHKKGIKLLKLDFEVKNNNLIVSIEDNGIGIEASKKLNALRPRKHESFATQANQKRFEILNQASLYNIGVQTSNIENHMKQCIGTRVVLSIPV